MPVAELRPESWAILDYLSQFNGIEVRTSTGRLEIAVAKTSGGEQPVPVLPSAVPLGSFMIVEDLFDGFLPTSLRAGIAEFIFAGFTAILPSRYDS